MSLDTALVGYLKTHERLTPLIQGRLFPGLAPQNTPVPYINYFEVDNQGVHHLRGASTLALADYQWAIWSTRHQDVSQGAQLLRFALDGFRGRLSDTDIRFIRVLGQRDIQDDDEFGGQGIYFGKLVETRITFMQQVTTFPYYAV